MKKKTDSVKFVNICSKVFFVIDVQLSFGFKVI